MEHEQLVTIEQDRRASLTLRPAALVVHRDPVERIRRRVELSAAGYDVLTCGGPTLADCPFAWTSGAPPWRCTRVPRGTKYVEIERGPGSSRLVHVYRAWLPEADVVLTD